VSAYILSDVAHYVPKLKLEISHMRRIGDDHIIRLRPR
jgi:hypothetical protein